MGRKGTPGMNATWLFSLFPRAWRDRYDPAFRGELERRFATFMDVLDVGLGALDAHLRHDDADGESIPERPPAGIAGQHPSQPSQDWMSVLLGHVVLFLVVNAILTAINLLTDRSTLWVLYPMWGMGIALLLHIGLTFPGRNGLRAHALLAAWIGAGLAGIDIATGDPAWAMWVIWPLAGLPVSHALRSRRVIGTFGVHVLLVVLGGLEALALAAVTPSIAGDVAITFGMVLATVAAHAMIRYGQARLLTAHITLFTIGNALLLVRDALDGGGWWVRYPLLAWSTLFVIHAVLATQSARNAPAAQSHALAALARFADRSALGPATRRLQSLLTHAALFGIATIELLILFLISRDEGLWMIWPLGVWLVILIAHGGVVVLPDRPALAINLFGGAAIALGLVAIDMSTGGGSWAPWPIAGWLIVLAMHAGAGLAHLRTWFRLHLAGTATAIAVLVLLYAVGIGGAWVVWPIWALAILLAIHSGIVVLPRQPALGVWVLAGGVILAGLVLIDMEAGGRAWAYWPVAVWVFLSVVIFGLGIAVSQAIAADRDRPERFNSPT